MRLFPGWNGRFEQLSRGRFEGTLQLGRSRRAVAHRATSNQVLRVRGREVAGMLTIAVVLPRSEGSSWQGRHLQAGHLVIRDGQTEANHLATRNTESLMLGVPESVFRDVMAEEIGDVPILGSWRSLHVNPDAFVRVRDAVLAFLCESEMSGKASDDIERQCITAAIEAIVPENRGYGVGHATRVALIRRAEATMRDRLGETLAENDLCRKLGVSGRTLRLAFQAQFGMGPAAYFQTLRLNAARSALKQAHRTNSSVAGIAREYGFAHLGKFAGYYRRLFHELPSTTFWRR